MEMRGPKKGVLSANAMLFSEDPVHSRFTLFHLTAEENCCLTLVSLFVISNALFESKKADVFNALEDENLCTFPQLISLRSTLIYFNIHQ